MPDYAKCVMYKICCRDREVKEIYVGSTCNIIRRRSEHKYNCNTETSKKYNVKVYQFIRECGGWNNWEMVPIEEYPCENKIQKEIRERYWIEFLKSELNGVVPNRNWKERRNNKEVREQIKKTARERYKNNIEKMREKCREKMKKW